MYWITNALTCGRHLLSVILLLRSVECSLLRVRQKRAKMALLSNAPRGRFRKEISGTMREREKERGKDHRLENCVTSSCPLMALRLCFYISVAVVPRQPKM